MNDHVRNCFPTLFLIAVCTVCPALSAQEFDESFDHWPIDFKINGKVMIASQLAESDAIDKHFYDASGGEKAKLVVITLRQSDPSAHVPDFSNAAETRYINSDPSDVVAAEAFAVQELPAATGVMLYAERAPTSSERLAIHGIRAQLSAVVERGGVIYASGPVAKMLSRVEITGGANPAETSTGLNLVPDSVIVTTFSGDGDRERVHRVLVSHPRTVAIGLEKNTAVVLDGRILRVLDAGRATVMIAGNERVPQRSQTIEKQASRRQPPNDYLIDLTQWRRVAMERTLAPFPPAKPQTPSVKNGALVIVGGGGMPRDLMRRFVELAGGVEEAKLVYVPCSEADQVTGPQNTVVGWKKMGVQHATFMHTKDRHQANSDATFLAPLKDATGIWFGGGRQWNFADSYYGTTAHKLMKEVLRRGGVIGGSSAGASIQARYLARATPISNVDIMAPGYERGGLGFISGVAIDQHFSQRRRQRDMTQLMDRYPQMLGIGIDEATAIIVRESKANVVGSGKVYFYNRNLPVEPDQPDFVALPAGSSYDLAARTVVAAATTGQDAADTPAAPLEKPGQ